MLTHTYVQKRTITPNQRRISRHLQIALVIFLSRYWQLWCIRHVSQPEANQAKARLSSRCLLQVDM